MFSSAGSEKASASGKVPVDGQDAKEPEEQVAEPSDQTWREQLQDALWSVKAAAAVGRSKLLAKVVAACESESPETVGIVTAALRGVAANLGVARTDEAGDDEAGSNVAQCDSAAEADQDEKDEEAMEDALATSVDEFQREFGEAMAHVRGLGGKHGLELTSKFSAMLTEINGRDPTQQELRSEEFEEEDTRGVQDDQPPADALQAEDFLFQHALQVVPASVQRRAVTTFAAMVGRGPTEDELRTVLVAVMASPDVDCSFSEMVTSDEQDADDSDYQPVEESDDQLSEDELFGAHMEDKLAAMQAEVAELRAGADLDTPPRQREDKERGDASSDFVARLTQELVAEVVAKFAKEEGRDPDEQELQAMAQSMVEKPLLEAEFDSASDSDYVPEQDECEDADEEPDAGQDPLSVMHRMTQLFERLSADNPDMDDDALAQLYERRAKAWLQGQLVATEFDDKTHRVTAIDFDLTIDSLMVGEDEGGATIREHFAAKHDLTLMVADAGMLIAQVGEFEWRVLPPEVCFLVKGAADNARDWEWLSL